RDTEEDEADPHAGAEEHHEPGDDAELRPLVVTAQPDAADPGEGAEEHEDEEEVHGDDVPPAHAVRDRRVKDRRQVLRLSAEDEYEADEAHDDRRGGDEDGFEDQGTGGG